MEVLSPAGNLQKLKYAVYFGADAVYAGGSEFGLRANCGNLNKNELHQAASFCREQNRNLYITVNIFPRNDDLKKLPEYLSYLQELKVDGLIISDPGIFRLAREFAPEIPIHISTQANVTSWKSAQFWYESGAKRIVLARELGITEIIEIREKLPDLELEIFVHGAMCMAYSGRCLLSSFLNNRSANSGDCSQPCRWSYNLVEETRPGEFFPLEQDKRGSYIMNSKDLCLFDRLPEIVAAGIDSIKIEGRMKSLYYVANLSRVYKHAVQSIRHNQPLDQNLRKELDKISHRHYTQGFFSDPTNQDTLFHNNSSYLRNYQFIGEIIRQENNYIEIPVKAKFVPGDELEIIFPDPSQDYCFTVEKILSQENEPLIKANPNTIVKVLVDKKFGEAGIIRKKVC
ncbi:MAG: U32 family peptidase [Candidatus Cloacimonetes bacterium]|nr:U32 family peptidase [Candidatus Cloacimonadota bacterium]